MSAPPGRLRSTIYGLLVALSLFGLLELGARIIEHRHPSRAVDLGLGFEAGSRIFIEVPGHPELRRTAVEKRPAVLDQTFAAIKPPGTLRIFALGESSVRNLQPQLQELRARLAQRLGRPVELINVGANSYGSQRLVPIARELLDYQPDVVLLYLGHNEFEELEQLRLVSPSALPLQRAASHLALFRVLRDLLVSRKIEELAEQNRRVLSSPKPEYQRAWDHHFTAGEAAERMRAFHANLVIMVELFTSRGVKLVMGTIPSNRFNPVLPPPWDVTSEQLRQLQAAGRWREADALAESVLRNASGRHQSSSVENELLRKVAQEHAVPFAEVEREVCAAEPHGIPGETMFVDHCHLNARGRELWERAYQAELDKLLP